MLPTTVFAHTYMHTHGEQEAKSREIGAEGEKLGSTNFLCYLYMDMQKIVFTYSYLFLKQDILVFIFERVNACMT